MTARLLTVSALAFSVAAVGCGTPPPEAGADASTMDAETAGPDADGRLVIEPSQVIQDSTSGQERRECVLDFGFVQTGARATAAIALTNLTGTDIDVSALALTQDPSMRGDAFSLEGPPVAEITVRAGETVRVPLAFLPTLLGGYEGRLTFETTDVARATGTCWLRGSGGGPVLDVEPTGPIGLGAVNGVATGTITLSNLGTQITGTTEDGLRFAAPDLTTCCAANEQCPDGFCLRGQCWKEKRVEVEMLEGSAERLTLTWPPEGYLSTGLPAGASLELLYRFAPVGPAARKANIKIRSTDPGRPLVTIEVSGSGV
ncbi:MAG: hypothetical protein QM765_15660 [Myxococcales bacterium]